MTSTLLLTAALIVGLIGVAGCAALLPSAALVELAHESHIGQHFQSQPTNWGVDTLSAGLKWTPLPHTAVVIEDGLALESCNSFACGALVGPCEVFDARITTEIPLR